MLTEYRTHEMVTISERKLRNALKFGTTREVNTQEGVAQVEGLLPPPTNCSEVVSPKAELNRAMGEALIPQPPLQRPQTKLVFNVRIDNPFFD